MIKVYTDGACSGNPGPGGVGIIILYDDKKFKFSGYLKNTTNNQMELFAPILALYKLCDKNDNNNDIIIYSDSNYLVKGMTEWIKNWKRNGWMSSSGQPVKNKTMWVELDKISKKFKSVSWVWVKGHSQNVYNNYCDTLATDAIKFQKGIPFTEVMDDDSLYKR